MSFQRTTHASAIKEAEGKIVAAINELGAFIRRDELLVLSVTVRMVDVGNIEKNDVVIGGVQIEVVRE